MNADYSVWFDLPNWTASYCIHPDYGEHTILKNKHLDICLQACENQEKAKNSGNDLLSDWSLDTSRTD